MDLPAVSLPDPQPRPIDHLPLCGRPDDPALVAGGVTMDYAALNRRIGQVAAWLDGLGLPAGARVATWLPKHPLACLMPLAAPRAGLVHVPVNPLLKRAQVDHVMADSGAAVLVSNRARLDTLGSGHGVHDVEAIWPALDVHAPLAPSAADPAALAALFYTSGSTGRPKGVMLSHANLWLGAQSVAHYLGLARHDRVLAVLPLAFDYGQNQLLGAWAAGAVAIAHDYLLPRDVLRACLAQAITTLAGVPPLWRQLAALDWPQGMALARLTNSGGALDAALVRRLRALAGPAQIYAMYGLTEAFRSTYLDPALIDAHPTAIGRAIPFADVMVVRDDGSPAAPGEEGELVHAGPLVAQGYWNDPAATAARFRAAPAWSRLGGTAVWSGDRVRQDHAGLLHFVGRRDALIKTAGNRVSPQEIEEAALATGLVVEAAAFGLPDPALGQAIHLVVEPAGDAAHDALLPALARELPNFMLPARIHWRAHLPLNPNGKLDRAALYRELAETVDRGG